MLIVDEMLTGMKRQASTHGGEYAGACPFCGGTDRFRVWPEHPDGKARWWCRQCGRWGDAADLEHELRGVPLGDALRSAGIELKRGGKRPAGPRERPLKRPGPVWQQQAERVAVAAEGALWQASGRRALAYLHKRGLTDDTIRGARLGYIARDRREQPDAWGLPADHKPVWLPRGIVIPWRAEGMTWNLRLRRPAGEPKYGSPAGSCAALYGRDGLRAAFPAVLLEGEFDALSLAQQAGDLVAAVATGSTSGARHPHWQRLLCRCSTVLVAFDSDDAGEQAAAWWLQRLPNARRLCPEGHDVNEMLTDGANLREWVQGSGTDAVLELPEPDARRFCTHLQTGG